MPHRLRHRLLGAFTDQACSKQNVSEGYSMLTNKYCELIPSSDRQQFRDFRAQKTKKLGNITVPKLLCACQLTLGLLNTKVGPTCCPIAAGRIERTDVISGFEEVVPFHKTSTSNFAFSSGHVTGQTWIDTNLV